MTEETVLSHPLIDLTQKQNPEVRIRLKFPDLTLKFSFPPPPIIAESAKYFLPLIVLTCSMKQVLSNWWH